MKSLAPLAFSIRRPRCTRGPRARSAVVPPPPRRPRLSGPARPRRGRAARWRRRRGPRCARRRRSEDSRPRPRDRRSHISIGEKTNLHRFFFCSKWFLVSSDVLAVADQAPVDAVGGVGGGARAGKVEVVRPAAGSGGMICPFRKQNEHNCFKSHFW